MKFISLLATLTIKGVDAFTVGNLFTPNKSNRIIASSSSHLNALLSLDLEKPLGLILEENVEGGSEGVKVEQLSDSGSAYASAYREKLVGLKIAKIMDNDVTSKFVN